MVDIKLALHLSGQKIMWIIGTTHILRFWERIRSTRPSLLRITIESSLKPIMASLTSMTSKVRGILLTFRSTCPITGLSLRSDRLNPTRGTLTPNSLSQSNNLLRGHNTWLSTRSNLKVIRNRRTQWTIPYRTRPCLMAKRAVSSCARSTCKSEKRFSRNTSRGKRTVKTTKARWAKALGV